MLMKFIKVSSDGSVSGLENPSVIKYSYGSMLNLRVKMVFDFFIQLLVNPVCSLYKIWKDQNCHMQQGNRKFIIERLCIGFGGFLSNLKLLEMYNLFQREV